MNVRNVGLMVSLLFALSGGTPCFAESQPQVQISFPLQGYYRPGKYMPVRVRTDAATPAPVVLKAEGAVDVSVGPGSTAMDTIVPWLAADVVRLPRWEIEGAGGGAVDVKFTAIEPGQVLVGVVSADMAAATAAAAADLFPGKMVIPLALTGSPPLQGDLEVWEALDAIVVETAGDVPIDDLLGRGVSIVVRSDARPSGVWAWQGGPGRWWMSFDVAGPRGAIHPEIYQPISAWDPGWPAPLRQRAMLLAVVYCLVALAMTLWLRTRQAVLAVVVVSVSAAAGFAWWGSRQSMVWQATTGVTVSRASGTQYDFWTYVRPLRAGDVALDRAWLSKPIFASSRHLAATNLQLHVSSGGRPVRFRWTAKPGTTLAFLRRGFDPAAVGAGLAPAPHAPSPARELVVGSYIAPGDVVLDTSNDNAPPEPVDWLQAWPPVIIRRGKP